MKVLVTGANGFLGAWLTRKLCEMNYEVSILVRPSSDLSELEGLNFTKEIGDITDLKSVSQACKGKDLVFHLAGLIAYTSEQRKKMEEVNVGGTANIIEAVHQNQVSRLIHVSSVTAIGAGFTPHPLNEKSEYNINHLDLGYFQTKHESEKLVKKACDDGRIDAVILNPSTIYGFGDAKKGSRKSQVKVAQGKMPFYTSGGVNVVPVEAAVDGIIKAISKGQCGERYILSGENITIKELFEIIADEAGVAPPKIALPKAVTLSIGKLGDWAGTFGLKGPLSYENAWAAVLFHWFDSSKAQSELGFEPGSAREAIRNSVQWMRENQYL